MSIVVRFSPIALTANRYDETLRQIKNAGEWPPAGLDYHVCFGADGNLKVSEPGTRGSSSRPLASV